MTPITALLGQSRSSYRIRDAMDLGLIVLACPGSGGARDRLVANLLVFDLLHAAKARADMAPERRRPFFVVLDEVQTYDGGRTMPVREARRLCLYNHLAALRELVADATAGTATVEVADKALALVDLA